MKTVERPYVSQSKRCLSAHEISALLLLRQAPIEMTKATPDVVVLHEAGLVQLIESEGGKGRFTMTAEGDAVLRLLGVA
jgi:hypothetical protein